MATIQCPQCRQLISGEERLQAQCSNCSCTVTMPVGFQAIIKTPYFDLPAFMIRRRCDHCNTRLQHLKDLEFSCPGCGKTYQFTNGATTPPLSGDVAFA